MRVQIPAYTDRWMMGDRYGEVIKVTVRKERYVGVPSQRVPVDNYEVAHVKLDKSGKMIRCVLSDCTEV
jgi:hypothetical protein